MFPCLITLRMSAHSLAHEPAALRGCTCVTDWPASRFRLTELRERSRQHLWRHPEGGRWVCERLLAAFRRCTPRLLITSSNMYEWESVVIVRRRLTEEADGRRSRSVSAPWSMLLRCIIIHAARASLVIMSNRRVPGGTSSHCLR